MLSLHHDTLRSLHSTKVLMAKPTETQLIEVLSFSLNFFGSVNE